MKSLYVRSIQAEFMKTTEPDNEMNKKNYIKLY
jgi:hypothetical protein